MNVPVIPTPSPALAAAIARLTGQMVNLRSAVAAMAIARRLGRDVIAAVGAELRQHPFAEQARERMKKMREADSDYDQSLALEAADEAVANHSLLLIAGPAGSGKTYLAVEIARRLKAEGKSYWVAAPTNKAVSVLVERGLKANTIHRLLYVPSFPPAIVSAIAAFIQSDGATPLPSGVKPVFTKAWAFATDANRASAKNILNAAPLAAFSGTTLAEPAVTAALIALGLGDGLMAVCKPVWAKRVADDVKIDAIILDETSMVNSRDLAQLRQHAKAMILIGDVFQLPCVVDAEDQEKGTHSALFDVRLDQQIHLVRDRRVEGGSKHLVAATNLLGGAFSFRDFVHAARDIKPLGVAVARVFDATSMHTAPAIVYYNRTVIRLAVAHRQALGLPENELQTGERLIIRSLDRRTREKMMALVT